MIKELFKQKSRQLGNIIWHIENNRKTIGDTKTLEDVHESLKILKSEFEEIIEVIEIETHKETLEKNLLYSMKECKEIRGIKNVKEN